MAVAEVTRHNVSASLADAARNILADKASDRFERAAAQTYLDNLADGFFEPDELIWHLAEFDARHEFRGEDWAFGDWFDAHESEYVAERRMFHGMIGGAA